MPSTPPLSGAEKLQLINTIQDNIARYNDYMDDRNFTKALIETFEQYRETFDEEDDFQEYLDCIIKQAFYEEDINLIQYFLNKRTDLSEISKILTKKHSTILGPGQYKCSSSDVLNIIEQLDRNTQRDELIKLVIQARNDDLSINKYYKLIMLYTDAKRDKKLEAFVEAYHFELLKNYMWQDDIDTRVYRAFEVYAQQSDAKSLANYLAEQWNELESDDENRDEKAIINFIDHANPVERKAIFQANNYSLFISSVTGFELLEKRLLACFTNNIPDSEKPVVAQAIVKACDDEWLHVLPEEITSQLSADQQSARQERIKQALIVFTQDKLSDDPSNGDWLAEPFNSLDESAKKKVAGKILKACASENLSKLPSDITEHVKVAYSKLMDAHNRQIMKDVLSEILENENMNNLKEFIKDSSYKQLISELDELSEQLLTHCDAMQSNQGWKDSSLIDVEQAFLDKSWTLFAKLIEDPAKVAGNLAQINGYIETAQTYAATLEQEDRAFEFTAVALGLTLAVTIAIGISFAFTPIPALALALIITASVGGSLTASAGGYGAYRLFEKNKARHAVEGLKDQINDVNNTDDDAEELSISPD